MECTVLIIKIIEKGLCLPYTSLLANYSFL